MCLASAAGNQYEILRNTTTTSVIDCQSFGYSGEGRGLPGHIQIMFTLTPQRQKLTEKETFPTCPVQSLKVKSIVNFSRALRHRF